MNNETANERFLFDANVFLTPYHKFYNFTIAPGYWDELADRLASNCVVVLSSVKNEIMAKQDALSEWLDQINCVTYLDEKSDQDVVMKYTEVIRYIEQNKSHLSDRYYHAWMSGSAADPWLVATAAAHDMTIITFEVPVNVQTAAKEKYGIKIPNIASAFGAKWSDLFYFMDKTDIRWRRNDEDEDIELTLSRSRPSCDRSH